MYNREKTSYHNTILKINSPLKLEFIVWLDERSAQCEMMKLTKRKHKHDENWTFLWASLVGQFVALCLSPEVSVSEVRIRFKISSCFSESRKKGQ